jgi:phosphonopyruvate decarboxylase
MSSAVETSLPRRPHEADGLAADLVSGLAAAGFTHATGVPCSLLGALFAAVDSVESPLRYIPAVREDTALGIASGLTLGGERPVVLMQNSGLGYCMNVLTSFNLVYGVGLAMIVSWRGHGGNDAVEHDVIGRTLTQLLDVIGIPWVEFDTADPYGSLAAFLADYDGGRSCAALIVREGLSA